MQDLGQNLNDNSDEGHNMELDGGQRQEEMMLLDDDDDLLMPANKNNQ